MRYLISGSLIVFLLSCTSIYKGFKTVQADPVQLQTFKPVYHVALYKAGIDVVGNHLSGLLLFKKMPDSSTRIVFTSETGFSFFDFEFAADGTFKVHNIFKKMNRKAVIKTLRKDFELVLMNRLDNADVMVKSNDGMLYFIYPQSKGFYHYITDSTGRQLIRMERASKSKPVTQAVMTNYSNGMPDSISISHTKFEFNIGLKKIER